MCRIVQWRHQVLRRKGYLKFYRNMRNVRRVPFIVVSIGKTTGTHHCQEILIVVACITAFCCMIIAGRMFLVNFTYISSFVVCLCNVLIKQTSIYTCYYTVLPPANAAVLLLVSLLYFYRVHDSKVVKASLYPVDFLYVIVGLELVFVLPCLVYYIGMTLSLS